MKIKKALVLFSGGQDSTACLLLAQSLFEETHTISFDYGQHHDLEPQVLASRSQYWGAKSHYNVQLLDYPQWTHSALFDQATHPVEQSSKNNEEDSSKNAFPLTFVPGRNLLFLNIAGIYAHQQQMDALILGVSEVDYSGYPDCRAEFIQAAEKSLQLALAKPIKIFTPLIYMNKAEIWAMMNQFHPIDLLDSLIKSCYTTRPSAAACGNCPACQLRQSGLKRFEENPELHYARAQLALDRACSAFQLNHFKL